MKLEEIKTTFMNVIKDFADELSHPSNAWFTDNWINQNLLNLPKHLDTSLDRWRKMYQSARTLLTQATQQIENGHLRIGSPEYKKYKRRQDQSIRQLNLLRNQRRGSHELNEFYPYRYFASEGFLPGYNFTRLPLRTFLPIGSTSGEYISRPRSIALREFGPRNLIYYNGRKYRVSRLITQNIESTLEDAKISINSGYFLKDDQKDLEICPFSGLNLSDNANCEYLHHLLEMSESRAEETSRITCEEEERNSRGYDIDLFFCVDGGDLDSINRAVIRSDDTHLLNLRFIPAARLISLNRGWRARKVEGFPLGTTSEIGAIQCRNPILNPIRNTVL